MTEELIKRKLWLKHLSIFFIFCSYNTQKENSSTRQYLLGAFQSFQKFVYQGKSLSQIDIVSSQINGLLFYLFLS